jgi:hypothetical protein
VGERALPHLIPIDREQAPAGIVRARDHSGLVVATIVRLIGIRVGIDREELSVHDKALVNGANQSESHLP